MDSISERHLEQYERSLENKRREIERTRIALVKEVHALNNKEQAVSGSFQKIKAGLVKNRIQDPKVRICEARQILSILKEHKLTLSKVSSKKHEISGVVSQLDKVVQTHDNRLERVGEMRIVIRGARLARDEQAVHEENAESKIISFRSQLNDSSQVERVENYSSASDSEENCLGLDQSQAAIDRTMIWGGGDGLSTVTESPDYDSNGYHDNNKDSDGKSEEQIADFSFDIKTKSGGTVGFTASNNDATHGVDVSLRASTAELEALLQRVRSRINDNAKQEGVAIRGVRIEKNKEA